MQLLRTEEQQFTVICSRNATIANGRGGEVA